MILEINLVKTPSIDSTYGQLLIRKREQVTNESEALEAILKVIQGNFEFIDGVIGDKLITNRLSSISSLSVNELYELKYYLNYYGGLDIWYWYVNEMEVGAEGIDDGMAEYSIVDRTSIQALFIPFVQRFNMESDNIRLSKVFTKIQELTNVFNSELSEGLLNPIKNQIDALIPNENATGTISNLLTCNINSIFKFMGRDIYTITG